MPAKSKQQYKFMKAVAQGDAKAKGLSKKEAKEYVSGMTSKQYKKLPKKKKRKGK